MCPTPTPVNFFGEFIMRYIALNRFDLVKKSIEAFEESGYKVYHKKITKEEYNTPEFETTAKIIMRGAKDVSNGWQYNGIIVFFPFIRQYTQKRLVQQKSIERFAFDVLLDKSCVYNEELCINTALINRYGTKPIRNKDIYLMVFYHKEGINWE